MALGEGNQKFKLSWKLAFFVAACLVTAAGVLSILSFTLSITFDPMNFVSQIYLLALGLLMMVLDIPPISHQKASGILSKVRRRIYENFLFMTRFSGRGGWYLFLGTLVFIQLWDNDVSPFLGFFFGGYIIILAGVSLYFSIVLSMRLEKVRKKLNDDMKQNRQHWGNTGLTMATFKSMAKEQAAQDFTDDEMVYIHNAVEMHPLAHLADQEGQQGNNADGQPKISKQSVEQWVQGGLTFV